MNSLVIPPSSNWYSTSLIACSEDNTLIYGARNDIVVICPSETNKAADVKIISRAHSQKIVSVNLNKNWGAPHKYAVTVSEDKIVKLWDMEVYKKKLAHNEHLKHEKVVGANFAGDDRIVSVSEDGKIIVWNIVLNEFRKLEIFGTKDVITCISTCPHASWLTAFGLKNGIVCVCDLRRDGKILYRLRGHDKSVLSLAWCPAPVNIFPQSPRNTVGLKKIKTEDDALEELCEKVEKVALGDEKTEDADKKTDDSPAKKVNPWINLKHADDDEVPPDFADKGRKMPEVFDSAAGDFLSECDQVKKQILGEAPEKVVCNIEKIVEEKSHEVEKPANEDNTEKIIHESNTDGNKIEIDKPTIDEEKSDKIKSTNEEVGRNITESVEEQPRKEFLLASSAREGHIYIWRAGTDGRMQTFFTLPNKPGNRKSGRSSNDKIWITLCWPTAGTLLSSSKTGELIQWSLPKPKDKERPFKLIHKDHGSTLFSIAAPIPLLNEFNWKNESVANAWTVGLDRLILNTSLTPERTNLACYPTFGGQISCIASSPVDPNRVAIGAGEGVIKVWDMSRPHTKNIVMSNFYNKIQSRVTSVAWHPLKELMLAYATQEGRIGMFDTSNSSKNPAVFKHFFKSQVHKIEFGPIGGNRDDLGIYAVSEGKLVVFDVKHPDKDPIEIETPDNTFVYMFSWKPDYSKLLVSTKAKTLLEYSADLKLDSTHYIQQKFDQIMWHPDAFNNNHETSKYEDCFAGTYASKEFMLYTVGKSEGEKENTKKTFSGHGEIVNSLAWSPFDGRHIVSVGDDGVAQVWDIETDSIIATYIHNNYESILSVMWSPVDPDHIIIGGKDYVVSIWKVSEHPARPVDEVSEARKKTVKEIQNEMMDLLPKLAKISDESEKTKAKKPVKNGLLPAFYNPKDAQTHIADLQELLDWKESGEEGNDRKSDITKLFATNADMIEILTENQAINKKKGKYNNSNVVALMKGDIQEGIVSAINEKRVTPWILSVAPMVSTEIWQKACNTYTEQLREQPEADPLEIMTYLLAQHKITEAVDVLCENSMYREALALAKSRLPDGSAITRSVVEKWAQNSVFTGQFEVAAQCYIALGQYEQAASVLYRRSDLPALELAALLAKKSGNEEMHKAIMSRHDAFTSSHSKVSSDAAEQLESTSDNNKASGDDEGDQNSDEIEKRIEALASAINENTLECKSNSKSVDDLNQDKDSVESDIVVVTEEEANSLIDDCVAKSEVPVAGH